MSYIRRMQLETLESKINYQFQNRALLKEAMTHSSYAYFQQVKKSKKKNLPWNERLEFLGDAVLNLIIAEELFRQFPSQPEGWLSKTRSQLVNARILAEKARLITLGQWMSLGPGEIKTKGRDKERLLADAFEALIGAIYLDGGLQESKKLITQLFSDEIQEPAQEIVDHDSKSELQEIFQEQFKMTPTYELISERGPNHKKEFCVALKLHHTILAESWGKSKKEASQNAASVVLNEIKQSEFFLDSIKELVGIK